MLPVYETPSGTVDGVNDTFFTLSPYTAGTLAVYINGQLVDFGAFVETSPATGELTITSADCIPRSGVWGSDTIAVFYLDTTADTETLIVEGIIVEVADAPVGISGDIGDFDATVAQVALSDVISAAVVDDEAIPAAVNDTIEPIAGAIAEC